jgi:acid phosphatase
MTTLKPRDPYTPEELEKLYPANLELRLVQVLLRHGERAPVSVRFQNASPINLPELND